MQRNSIYNKLRVILSSLRRRKFADTHSLAVFLEKEKLDEFEVPTKGSRRIYCEAATIRKTIGLSIRLKLISEDGECALTTDGASATHDEASFKNILAARIVTYLGEKDFGIQRILETIDKIAFPDLPEADLIYERGKTPDTQLDEDEFRRLLYLLALCDKLDRQAKYLYLRKRKKAES
jgi:hypothetical protein